MSKIVIANATPIVSLCSVRAEFILKELFHQIVIPEGVRRELCVLNKPGADFPKLDWVEVRPVQNEEFVLALRKDVDQGEAETIALAKQLHADIVIIDEQSGYQIAKRFDLPAVRTLSLLKIAKDKQIIQTVKPIVEEMLEKGRWYSQRVLDKFLRDIGE